MAGKRDFHNFIDLTGTDEDKDIVLPSIESDEGPPVKLSRVEYGRQEEHHVHSQHLRDNNNSFFPASGFTAPPPAASRPITNLSRFEEHPSKSRGSGQPDFPGRGSRLALQIIGFGLQKSVYDSNTIARDVLIAFDAHPERGGLNSHIKTHLLSLFNAIGDRSDLGTIDSAYFQLQHTVSRGSLNDPGGNITPTNQQPLHMPQNAKAERVSMRNSLIPTSGGNYLGSNNRGQPMANFQSQDSRSSHHGNTHAGTWHQHQQQLTSMPSHLSSLRYGDTNEADTNAFARQNYQQHDQPLSYQSRSGYTSPYGQPSPSPVQPQPVPQYKMHSFGEGIHAHPSGGSSSTPRASMSSSAVAVILPQKPLETLSSDSNTPARRGRQPKAIPNLGAAAKESGAPKRRGRPPKDYTALVAGHNPDVLLAKATGRSPNATTAASNQAYDNTPPVSVQVPKKRGRPFKNPELAGVPVERVPKKRGRPFKDLPSGKQIVRPEPKYLKYKCEWRDCPAELHNLETHNLHVLKVHRKRESGVFSCLWNRCTAVQNTDIGMEASAHPRADAHYQFELEEEWLKHISDEHMQPYAWYMGDGPRSSLERSERSQSLTSASWLNDENGRQVTPSVDNQTIEYGNPKKNNENRFERKVSGLDVIFDPIGYTDSLTEPMQEQDGGSMEDEDMEIDSGEDGE